MKYWVVLIVSLVPLVSTAPGILVVRFGEDQETSFCISYSSSRTKFPSSYTDEDFQPLVDLSPDSLCEVPTDTVDVSSTIIVVPGTANCTVSDRLAIAEDMDAAGLIVVPPDDVLVYGNTTTNMSSVIYLEGEDYDILEEILGKYSGNETTAVFFAPAVPRYDPNMFVIWILATVIVAIGGFWSGLAAFEQYKKKLEERRSRTDSSEEDRDDQKEDEDGSVVITTMVVLIWVVLIVSFLLLLYFFYNIFVYVVIFMFCLGAWSGLYACLDPSVKRIFRWKASTPVIPYLKTSYSFVSLALTAVSLIPVVCWFVYRHEDFAWILQDFLGAAFCISMLKLIHLPNFKMCILLLGLLFFYDMFFVYITPLFSADGESVMVKVATGGDDATEQLPILFLFPSLTCSPFKVCKGFSMLGYGDVLIPGLLVGFCHGFDMKVRSWKVYFIGSTAAYAVGLMLTFVALVIMQTGQPALVYIVPSTLLTVSLIGCLRGDLRALWSGEPIRAHVPLGGEINTSVNDA